LVLVAFAQVEPDWQVQGLEQKSPHRPGTPFVDEQ
jgi:hypothetical protein